MQRRKIYFVIKRPEDLATDTSPTLDSIQHTLQNLEENYEMVVLLQPTNPLRPKELLRECWSTLLEKDCKSLFTVSENFKKLGKIDGQKFLPFNYEFGQRSQDMNSLYYENGLLYIAKTDQILKGKLIADDSYPFIVNHIFSNIDIDEQSDFDYAEFLFKKYLR